MPRKRCHTDHLVGIDSRVQSMMELLDIGLHDRKYVVIHGMGGIGKTTLANAIFDKLSAKFDNACFLEDVRESSCIGLQKKLLEGLDPKSIGQSNFLGDILKGRFYKRKVLIILDDVEKWEQIEKLVGKSCWFGAGSRIIITTRNKDVLNRGALDEDEVLYFEMETLVYEEAVALFCWYAFRKNNPSIGFDSLSIEIVKCAEGLPLILKVTGALLYKKDEKVWKDVVSRLKKLPFKDVAERLRISYDALEDDQRKIFLDIACLSYIAKETRKVVYMWEACELYPHYGLEVLSSMSLIRIQKSSIWMHNQLKHLGKKIVHEESEDPTKRSRLWVHKEAIQVLMSTEGKEKVEALVIEDGNDITLSNEHFASFRELRFLQLAGASITGDFENLLPNLRWLSWKYCPVVLNATNLFMKNLVNLDLSWSFITESWGGWKLIQILNNLKVLDLSYYESLTRTPEFSENNCLVRLVLSDCPKLREIHGSIGKLKGLKFLDLYSCDSLGGLPDEIGFLVNLEKLHASGSDSYNNFKLPNSIGCLKSLSNLELIGFGISEIPDSIGKLTKLKCLYLETTTKVLPESFGYMHSLVHLKLTISSECKFPNSLGRLVNLEELYVSGGMNLDELLQSLGNLKELKTLSLKNGIVKKIPALIENFKKLVCLRLDGVLEEVPTELCNLPSLRELTLRSSTISTLPSTFSELKLLEELSIGRNHLLRELPDLPLSLRRLRVSSRSLRKIANLSSLVNLNELWLLGAGDFNWSEERAESFEGGIEKLVKLQELQLGIATAKAILQFDLGSLTLLKSFTLDFLPDLVDSDARPLILPSASNSHGLKFPNLSSLKNVSKVTFRNCLKKDGLESLGIQHTENVNKVILSNCSVELIELTCHLKNLGSLTIFYVCGSFKKTLPDLSKWKNLKILCIYECEDVVEIPGLGSIVSLWRLYINCCKSLESLENISKLEKLSHISLIGCPKLKTIEGFEELFLDSLEIYDCGSFKTLPDLLKLKNIKTLYM